MTQLPAGSRNVLAKSLKLPDGIIECCKRFVNGKPQNIHVISASTTSTTQTETNTKGQPKEVTTRIFLNATEIGVGAEIIDRSKKSETKLRVVLYLQFQVSSLRYLPMRVTFVKSQ